MVSKYFEQNACNKRPIIGKGKFSKKEQGEKIGSLLLLFPEICVVHDNKPVILFVGILYEQYAIYRPELLTSCNWSLSLVKLFTTTFAFNIYICRDPI